MKPNPFASLNHLTVPFAMLQPLEREPEGSGETPGLRGRGNAPKEKAARTLRSGRPTAIHDCKGLTSRSIVQAHARFGFCQYGCRLSGGRPPRCGARGRAAIASWPAR